MKFNFKDKYTNYSGLTATDSNSFYYSPLTRGGDGTRANPFSLLNNTYSEQARTNQIISGGRSIFTFRSTYNIDRHLIGNGMGVTVLELNRVATDYSGAGDNLYFKDLTIKSLSINFNHNGTGNYRFTGCEVLSMPINTSTNGTKQTYFTRCKIKSLSGSGTTINHQNNNAYVGISSTIGSIAGSLHTFEKCNLIVNQTSLDSYKNNYYAFDNCNFRIGSETEYTPLTGTTAQELRNNFVTRCTAAGLTVPADITDYGITLTLGRWLFTKNQVFEGITWKGSEINQFETPRFISFGYSTTRGTKISITTDNNVPASFAPISSLVYTDGLTIAADSLSIAPEIDITQRHNLYIDSKIIWLGGKKKLTKIDVLNNMPYLYGVLIDSLPNLLCDSGQEVLSGNIEAGEMYMVRSKDTAEASVKYNNTVYSSALSSRNNIFRGVAGVTAFTANAGTQAVFKINDILGYQSIQMRIVNKIPPDIITSGDLTIFYWYLVEHDTDQSNTTDYVTYRGVNYKAGDSFVVVSMNETFTKSGNIHLRRCWNRNFKWGDAAGDLDFWQNEQKPDWFDVLPEDPRCLLKNNHPLSIEMMRGEDGKYITSGHSEYYNKITGASGIQSPNDIYIQGAYMQLRIPVTTVNPM